MELEKVLSLHFELYPKMRPQDAVKLIYQNEFGGGHLVKNREESYTRLIKELEITPTNPSLPLFVPIGNGLVRVNLAKISDHYITPDMLYDMFVSSAEAVKGSRRAFAEKLDFLKSFVEKAKNLPFSSNELSRYLLEYKMQGYPMCSHSYQYREYYAPAYRIVLADFI